jgi:hypothetical protein
MSQDFISHLLFLIFCKLVLVKLWRGYLGDITHVHNFSIFTLTHEATHSSTHPHQPLFPLHVCKCICECIKKIHLHSASYVSTRVQKKNHSRICDEMKEWVRGKKIATTSTSDSWKEEKSLLECLQICFAHAAISLVQICSLTCWDQQGSEREGKFYYFQFGFEKTATRSEIKNAKSSLCVIFIQLLC